MRVQKESTFSLIEFTMYSSPCNKLFLATICLAFLVLISSCSKDEDTTPDPDNSSPSGMDTCIEIDPSFKDDILPIIEATCAIETCHVSNGSGNGIFDSYDAIKGKVDNESLLRRAVTDANMPPASSVGPKPTAAQRNLIKCWIEDGAANN